MKKLFVYLCVLSVVMAMASCRGDSAGQTGGAQADSGQTNVGSSGATDSAAISAGSGSPAMTGTSGTDTSKNGRGTANPTIDTAKNNRK